MLIYYKKDTKKRKLQNPKYKYRKYNTCNLEYVHMTGFEPARPSGHQPLKLARLPIPPHVHKKFAKLNKIK